MSGQHFLVVAPFDPNDDDDRFTVEHPADCPRVALDAPDGAWRYDCAVEFYLDEGVSEYFRHADDPDRPTPWSRAEPVSVGRHEIEAWSHHSPGGPWGPDEWDGGLWLVEDAVSPAPETVCRGDLLTDVAADFAARTVAAAKREQPGGAA